MSYPKELKEQAHSILADRKSLARDRALQNRSLAYNRLPRLKEIDSSLSTTGAKVSRAILNGMDVEKNIAMLSEENLKLQREKTEILMNNGFSHDALEIKYSCEKCRDSGYSSNGMCSCLKELLKQLSYRKLSEEVNVNEFNFNTFSLSYYTSNIDKDNKLSPRTVMEHNFKRAREYAESFCSTSGSLLLLGKTGLGKTHLSVAIAGCVIEKGYDVIYSSAQNLLYKLEKERFSRENTGDSYSDYMTIVLSCNLLIIDDLGAEFSTNFTTSAIYNIINSRLLQGKPTIINSNLDTTKKLQERYSERFVSRLLGNYNLITFMGEDIRIQKKYK